MGCSAWLASDWAEMSERFQESLAILRSLGDRRGVAGVIWWFSVLAQGQGKAEEGERLARECLALFEELGVRNGGALYGLALALTLSGKYAEAHSLMEEYLAIVTDRGTRFDVDLVYSVYQSRIEIGLGLYEQARALAQRALEVGRDVRGWRNAGYTLCLLGSITLAEGAYEEAQSLLRESIAAYREIGMPDELGWALACAGYAARGLGQSALARRHLCEALRIGAEIRAFFPLITALTAVALLLADQGQIARAVELYACAMRSPYVAHSRWFQDVAGKQIAVAAASLSSEVAAAAQERGRARDLKVVAAELLTELMGGKSPQ